MSLKGSWVVDHRRMIVTLHTDRLRTLQHVREFLEGNQGVDLVVATRAAAYGFIEQTLGRFDYVHQGKAEKGLLRCFLAKVTGLSRAQLTRLLGPASGHREHRRPPRGAPTAVPPPLHEHRHRLLAARGSTAPCPGRRRKRYRRRHHGPMRSSSRSPRPPSTSPRGPPSNSSTPSPALSDNDAARALHEARARLFRSIDPAA